MPTNGKARWGHNWHSHTLHPCQSVWLLLGCANPNLWNTPCHPEIHTPVGHTGQMRKDAAWLSEGLIHIPQRTGATGYGKVKTRRGLAPSGYCRSCNWPKNAWPSLHMVNAAHCYGVSYVLRVAAQGGETLLATIARCGCEHAPEISVWRHRRLAGF